MRLESLRINKTPENRMLVYKKGFTLVEMLVASCILAMVLLTGVGIIRLISSTIFEGQTESNNRISLSDNVFYLTRELQSAEAIRVSADCKQLRIKQRGSSDYSLIYTISDGYPVGSFQFKAKRMFAVSYVDSSFQVDGKSIIVTLSIVKSSVNPNQIPQVICFSVTPRSSQTQIEGGA